MAKQKPYWWPVVWLGPVNLWAGEHRVNRIIDVFSISCRANHGFFMWIVVLNIGIRFGWEEYGHVEVRSERAWSRVREKLEAYAAAKREETPNDH